MEIEFDLIAKKNRNMNPNLIDCLASFKLKDYQNNLSKFIQTQLNYIKQCNLNIIIKNIVPESFFPALLVDWSFKQAPLVSTTVNTINRIFIILIIH